MSEHVAVPSGDHEAKDTPSSSRKGRPRHPVWIHFKKEGIWTSKGRGMVSCLLCNGFLQGVPLKMQAHICNECPEAPSDLRIAVQEEMAAAAAAAAIAAATGVKGELGRRVPSSPSPPPRFC